MYGCDMLIKFEVVVFHYCWRYLTSIIVVHSVCVYAGGFSTLFPPSLLISEIIYFSSIYSV